MFLYTMSQLENLHGRNISKSIFLNDVGIGSENQLPILGEYIKWN